VSEKINGIKIAVPDAGMASQMIVVVKSSTGTDLRLVDLEDASVTVTQQKNLDTSRAFFKVEFKDTPSRLIGKSGDGWTYIQHLLDQAAVLFAFEQVGGSQAALDMAKSYSMERFAFGRQIGSYQAIKHKLADMYIAVTLAKSNCYYGAWALSSESAELPLAAATARVSATKAFQLCSKENIQTHGGNGFTWEYDCHLFYKRSKVLSVLLGSEAAWKEKLVTNLEKTNTLAKG
jgi:acyl-CoA dehydrogenase